MSDSPKKRSEEDAALEEEMRKRMKFTLEAAIGRLAGPGAMKGQSPIPRQQQAGYEIESWLNSHLNDGGGALKVMLHRDVTGSELLLNDFDHPLAVLAAYCQHVLDSDYLLKELVRDLDVEWGRTMGERPYFEKEGRPCNPDDPYTIASVRNQLSGVLTQLAADNS